MAGQNELAKQARNRFLAIDPGFKLDDWIGVLQCVIPTIAGDIVRPCRRRVSNRRARVSRFLLVGMPGDASLSLIDLEGGSIEMIAPDSVDGSIAKIRESGATVFLGVDVAIAIDDRPDTVGRFFFDGGVAR